jgi:hypothetical protein
MVAQVLDERRLPSLRGHLAIAHCRYSTTGSTLWENSQPAYRLGPQRTVAVGHNGNLVNTRQLLELLDGGEDQRQPPVRRALEGVSFPLEGCSRGSTWPLHQVEVAPQTPGGS